MLNIELLNEALCFSLTEPIKTVDPPAAKTDVLVIRQLLLFELDPGPTFDQEMIAIAARLYGHFSDWEAACHECAALLAKAAH